MKKCPAHRYGHVPATNTVHTDYSTLHVCVGCADALKAGGFTDEINPLGSENPRQRCQCEHADHFAAEAV